MSHAHKLNILSKLYLTTYIHVHVIYVRIIIKEKESVSLRVSSNIELEKKTWKDWRKKMVGGCVLIIF